MNIRETCPCGAVFEGEATDTWSDGAARILLLGRLDDFRKLHVGHAAPSQPVSNRPEPTDYDDPPG